MRFVSYTAVQAEVCGAGAEEEEQAGGFWIVAGPWQFQPRSMAFLDVSSATSGSRDLNSNLEDIAAERIDLANRVRDRAGALSFEKFRHYLGGNLFLAEALSRRLDLNAVPKIAEGLCSRL